MRTLLMLTLLGFGLVHAAEERNFAVQPGKSIDKRVALVIGNAAYGASPLKNPVNDARAIAAKLQKLGFDVVKRENLTTKQIGAMLREFRSRLSPGSEALFFYAGHGLQVKGVNYLPAVDADITSEEDVPNQSINVSQILEIMDDGKTRLNLVFLDACRNNPFTRRFRSAGGGLARIEAPSGTKISFATRPGSVAADGDGRNGLYTEHLLRVMDERGLPIEQALKRVYSGVKQASKGAQEPWEEGTIEGEFYFQPAAVPSAPTSGAVAGDDPDTALWRAVSEGRSRDDYEVYVRQYPKGKYVALAQQRLQTLNEEAKQQLAQIQKAEAELSPGRVFRDCAECPEMVVIPAGEFEMGSYGGTSEERPVHAVRIDRPFALAKTEVTRGQFAAFVNATGYSAGTECYLWDAGNWTSTPGRNWRDPGYAQTDAHPVTCINWDDATAYVSWLSRRTGKAYRLPSDAEWEYAALGGTRGARYWGESTDQACAYANVADRSARLRLSGTGTWTFHECDDGFVYTSPVATFHPNAFGLYDMLGNVREFTADCWHDAYVGAPGDGSAWGGGDCTSRSQRGGSWGAPVLLDGAMATVVATRSSRTKASGAVRAFSSGFRPARVLP